MKLLPATCFIVGEANFPRFCRETPLPVAISFGQILPIEKGETKDTIKAKSSVPVINMTVEKVSLVLIKFAQKKKTKAGSSQTTSKSKKCETS